MRARWTRWAFALLIMLALLAAGCGGAGLTGADSGGGTSAGPEPARAPVGEAGKAAPESGAANAGGAAGRDQSAGSVRLVSLESRIIRNASVQIEIAKGRLDQTIQEANQVVARHQGIFAGSKTSAPDGGPSEGVVTFRVPNAQFEQTMAELKRLGTYRGESSNSSDVTSEYVDTKSQLDSWRAQERVYLRLMSEAKTIGETLAVRQRLDEVQTNINRLQGQLNVLDDQTTMATINLELREPGAVPAPEPTNAFARAWQTGVRGLEFMVQALIVAVMWLTPLAVVVVLLVLLIRALLRRPRPLARPAPQAPHSEG